MKKYRNPNNVHPPLAAYSHQIEIKEPMRWLVLSGQVGQDEDGSISDDPIQQLEVALENISHNLHAADMDVQDIVKLTFYLVGEMAVNKRQNIIDSWLKKHKPCMTLLYVSALAAPIFKVEVDAWACRTDG